MNCGTPSVDPETFGSAPPERDFFGLGGEAPTSMTPRGVDRVEGFGSLGLEWGCRGS